MQHLNSEYLFYQADKKLPYVDRAEGIYFWDHTGKEYIDGCSGAVICNLGHGNPRILAAIQRQATQTFFAYRLHFDSESAVRLAMKLVEKGYPHLNRVFYVSGGSEAVESALKLARQYMVARGEAGRHLFISRQPAYHGSTLGALALTSYAPLEIPFRPLTVSQPKIPAHYCYRCAYHLTWPSCDLACARALEETLRAVGPHNVIAFVAEPVVGASIGALVPPDGYYDIIQKTCRKYGILLILDEVMTAFGRTGTMFGYEHWQIDADIIALSKGMGAGYYPLGAIMAREEIVHAVLQQGGFMHGHTYAGNPMACAVGLEVINILEEDNLLANTVNMGVRLQQALARLAEEFSIIGQVRGLGLLMALELVQDRQSKTPFPVHLNMGQILTDAAYQEGLIIYPRRCLNGLAGDHVLVAPPLIITADQVDELVARLKRALQRMIYCTRL